MKHQSVYEFARFRQNNCTSFENIAKTGITAQFDLKKRVMV